MDNIMDTLTRHMIAQRYGLPDENRTFLTGKMDYNHEERDLKIRQIWIKQITGISIPQNEPYWISKQVAERFINWANNNQHHFRSIVDPNDPNSPKQIKPKDIKDAVLDDEKREIEDALKYWVQYELANGRTYGHNNFREKLREMKNNNFNYFTDIHYWGTRETPFHVGATYDQVTSKISRIDSYWEPNQLPIPYEEGITPAEILSQIYAGLFDNDSELLHNIDVLISGRKVRTDIKEKYGDVTKYGKDDSYEPPDEGKYEGKYDDSDEEPLYDGRDGRNKGLYKRVVKSKDKRNPQRTVVNKRPRKAWQRSKKNKKKQNKIETILDLHPDDVDMHGGKRKSTRKRKRKRKRKPTRKRKSTRKRKRKRKSTRKR